MPANPLQGGKRTDCHDSPLCPCCCCCGRTPCPAWSYFRLTKRDGVTGAPLAGALYTLYRGGREVVSDLSDPAGGLAFFPLAPGVYTLREVRPPAGYAPEEETHTVIVHENGGVTLDGRPAQGAVLYDLPLNNFRFSKAGGADGKPLAGAVFTLSDGRTAVSGADGEVSFGPLPPGRYTMKETSAPAGYLPNDREYGVAVAADGTITVDGTPLAGFRVENERRPASLSFRKKDVATGAPLAGAEFTLSDGQTAVSDAGGTVRFDNLAPGTYTLTESRAPDGYLPNPAVYTVTVSPDGAVAIDGMDPAGFTVEDTPYPILRFYKIDAMTGAPLAGAEFTLSNGQTAVSDANGLVDFGPVVPDLYSLTETAPPAGYEANPAVYSVLVIVTGEIYIDEFLLPGFVAENTPEG